ncbi:MAG: DUF4340 domain-containing protein [Candidatus Aminicenantes bacterium]|nr:MAG: DUF4340 domain-containing protein [Candidatus Aminicenantes bacterium]
MNRKSGIKKEYIVLGVIIVILLAFLLFQSRDKVHYKVPRLETVKKEDIEKVEIKKSDQTITLVKKDSQWLLDPQGYPTDADKVDRIMNTIAQLTLTDLVAKSKNYTLYDLTKEKAIHVKAFKKDQELRDFEIGKIASTYGHTFVKIKDNPNVYYARESFRSHFDTKVSELRDKTVMKLDSNEISEVEIEKEGKKYLFAKNVKTVEPPVVELDKTDDKKKEEKKEGEDKPAEAEPPKPEEQITWLMPDGKKGKKSQLDSLINQLTNLSCQEYIEDKIKEDFKTQAPIYTLKLKGSKDYIITFFSKPEEKEGEESSPGGEKYPVISSENAYPFLLSSWKAEQIMKKPEDLIEPLGEGDL